VDGSTVTVCIQNRDDGWIALGPGEYMKGTVIGYSGGGPPASWDIDIGKDPKITEDGSNGLNAQNFVNEVKNNKRLLCFDFADAKLEVKAGKAKFQWARGKSGVALNADNKHTSRGTFVFDPTDVEPGGPAESPSAESPPVESPSPAPSPPPVAPVVTVPPAWSEAKVERGEPSFLERNKFAIAGVLIVLAAGAGAYYYYYYLPEQEKALNRARRARNPKPSQRGGVMLRTGKRARRRPG